MSYNNGGYTEQGSSQALQSGGNVAAAPAKSRRGLWIGVGVVAALLVLGGIGAGVGVAVSNKNKSQNAAVVPGAGDNSQSNSGSSSGSSGNNSTDTDNQYANFAPTPGLQKIFYGMAYTPAGAVPDCKVSQEDVIKDIQLMSQMTNIVRTYGAGCNVPGLVLNAIKLTKVDLKVYLGNYITPGNDDSYNTQKQTIEDALKQYGHDNVLGVTVGNEVMLNACLDKTITDANSPLVKDAADYIVAKIADTRSSLAALGFTNIKVGNSDAGSYFATSVLEVSDYGLSNVHPWFAHTPVKDSVQWTWDFFEENNVQPAALLANKPEMVIAETGWPSGSKWANTTNNGAGEGGEASIGNLQIFLDEWVCQSNAKGIKYFYFELFDELWKDELYGGVEGYWGLLDSNKNLKPGITFPTCLISS
ncbi:glucan 1,3 beta-glucosidase [Auriculariales sp. MPI-PUGE-AT-0066]|nr:glucan 1,3 beta-glucosidase [Auriculariales sp. MPI-PUGE-AT-0066]